MVGSHPLFRSALIQTFSARNARVPSPCQFGADSAARWGYPRPLVGLAMPGDRPDRRNFRCFPDWPWLRQGGCPSRFGWPDRRQAGRRSDGWPAPPLRGGTASGRRQANLACPLARNAGPGGDRRGGTPGSRCGGGKPAGSCRVGCPERGTGDCRTLALDLGQTATGTFTPCGFPPGHRQAGVADPRSTPARGSWSPWHTRSGGTPGRADRAGATRSTP